MSKAIVVNDFSEYSLEGINCIEASAGTGKTYTISHLYLRFIIEKNLSIDNILVVTFTNAATDELRSRIRSLIKIAHDMLEESGDEEVKEKYRELYNYLQGKCNSANNGQTKKNIKDRLKIALDEIDKAHIYTIHSFCSRALSEFAFESRSLFGSQLIEDETPFMRRVVEDFYYTTIAPLGEEFVALFLQKNKDFVSWLLKVLHKLPDDPDVAILPDITFDAERLQKLLQKLTQRIATIREKFNKEYDKIKDNYYKALAQDVLNKNSFDDTSFQKLKEAIQMLSINTALHKDVTKNIEKFSLSNLLSKMKGEYKKVEKQYTWDEFFTLLDDCKKTLTQIKLQIIAAYREFIQYSQTQYSRLRDRWNIISFRDILKDMHNALQQGSDSKLAVRIRERFKVALIDEFQDTDPLQYTIFTTIFKKEGYSLYIIGDPKQAIYSFRGADVFAYIKARQSSDNIYTLNKSYRSTPSLARAINQVFSRIEKPFVFNKICYHPVESCVTESNFSDGALNIWFITQDDNSRKDMNIGVARKIIAKNMAREIQKLVQSSCIIDGKPLQYSDIAILVRKHHEAEMVQDILRQYGIHSVLYSRKSVFTTPEVWEVLHVLEAIINPASTMDVKRALTTSLFGYDVHDILEMEQHGSLDIIKMKYAAYLETWRLKGFLVMLQRLLYDDVIVKKKQDHDTVAQRLLQYNDGERVITNILQCAEILADIERSKKLDPVALVEWLKKTMSADADVEDKELRLESDANAVKIVTIHTSKGLEYPIVFCPYLFDVSSLDEIFVFHGNADTNYKTHVCFKLSKEESDEKALLFPDNDYDTIDCSAKCEQLSEALRVAYVAMTRAKYKCYVGWGKINRTNTSALRYLFHFRGKNDSHCTHDSTVSNNYPCTDNTPITDDSTSIDDAIVKFINGVERSYDDLLKDLKEIESSSQGAISVTIIEDIKVQAQEALQPAYPDPHHVKQLIKPIEPGWQLTSYTALTYRREDEKSDELQLPVVTKEEVKEQSVFTFPAGSISGLCIHNIFETIDFASDNSTISQVVTQTLTKYNIDTIWSDVLTAMVMNVLRVPLQANFVSLSHIQRDKRRHEVEFYYPVERCNSTHLKQLFGQHNLFTMHYAQALQKLSFTDISGFMHGYIDMVFEYNKAYYIVDWKSNLLGTSIADYHRSKLTDVIAGHLYFLQYSIYAVAIHRYLQLMLGKTYNYDKHFGGIFYIFVRGVDASCGYEYGIFYDKPDAAFINKLDNLLGVVTI